MTLVDLQGILGENIEAINSMDINDEDSEKIKGKGEAIARLAKQMINNADVILRTDKLVAEGKLANSTIKKVVGIDG